MIRPPKQLPADLREWSQFFRDTNVIAESLSKILPVSLGGTGSADAPSARTALDVPSRGGSGATGTWSISISGNAATATLANFATLAGNVTGVVAIANGGTGQSTAAAALTALGGAEKLTGTFTATLTGCTTSPTGTVTYSRSGSVVTLAIPQINGTSNTTAATLTGLPASLYPARSQVVPLRTTDNAVVNGGYGRVETSGVITLFPSAALGAFTSAGTKGVEIATVTYGLD